MAFATGTRLGSYEILGSLGVGGMGEVYRARDTSLGREVAIKVLPDAFARDPERLARFEREARTLASLNHPNIAIVHGFERSGGSPALVMELVEGPTLADRIAHGPMPVDEALPIARQIAEALEAAHEHHIIHRDLKPANIKVRADSTVKVLDFGLAKLNDPNVPNVPNDRNALTASPTMTSPALVTGVGMLLGTAAYMSPEQARGKRVDRRADVWAFGSVLYEMLTGKRAFEDEDVSMTLSKVLQREPDFDALPAGVPARVRQTIRLCLRKPLRERIPDIGAVRLALEGAFEATAHDITPSAAGPSVPLALARRRIALAGGAALLIGSIVTGTVIWFAARPAPPRVLRLAISTTPATALSITGGDRDLAITPDGSRVVYVGNNGTELFIRPLDALDSGSLFKGRPRGPFVAPDGDWLGFVDGATVLKKVATTGGPPVTIATVDGASKGAAWLPDDTIVFATFATGTGLQQVAAGGGPTTVLTRPDRARGEFDHLWPEPLPGGQAVLFTIWPLSGGLDAAQIAVFDRQSGTQKVVVRGGSHAHYVGSGHLVYAAANTLRAVAFDPVTLAVRGTPVPLVSEVVTTTQPPTGGVDAVIAADGTLAYVRGVGVGGVGLRTVVWVDRQGQETPIAAPPRLYVYLRASPIGNRVALNPADEEIDLWVWDFARLTFTRLTFNPGPDNYPVWTPDGRRLIFASDREGRPNLFWQAADGTGAAERLTTSPNLQRSTAVTPDGRWLIFTETTPTTGDDVMQVDLVGSHNVVPLLQSPFVERSAIVSPDGRWLAYEANDSGQFEIYVRPYPNIDRGRWQVSTGGGTRPIWSPTGQELFYVSPRGAILRVGVENSASWAATIPTTVVKEGYATAPGGNPGPTYDVSPDGRRFLLLKSTSEPTAPPPQLVVVQHFDEELRRLVPTN